MSTEALEALRDKQPSSRKKAVWRPPTKLDFVSGTVIAVDPSLGACGLVVLEIDTYARDYGRFDVLDAKVFRTEFTGKLSTEADLVRASQLTWMIGAWLAGRGHLWTADGHRARIVYEIPPEGGGSLRHLRSPLLSALAVREAAASHHIEVMTGVAAKTHKKFTCGNANAKKAEHHKSLMTLVDGELAVQGRDKVTNEALRDALSVGLAALSVERIQS